MKLEQLNQKIFLSHFPNPTPDILELSEHFWIDLTSHIEGYFNEEQIHQITVIAAKKLKAGSPWPTVVLDFVHNKNWGFQAQTKRPKLALSEDQKNSRKLFRYIWSFFQSMIILKIAVYYFGLEGAAHPDDINPYWVWLFFSISVGSLIYFAYRNFHDPDDDSANLSSKPYNQK